MPRVHGKLGYRKYNFIVLAHTNEGPQDKTYEGERLSDT